MSGISLSLPVATKSTVWLKELGRGRRQEDVANALAAYLVEVQG